MVNGFGCVTLIKINYLNTDKCNPNHRIAMKAESSRMIP